jgi:hypothetical protein
MIVLAVSLALSVLVVFSLLALRRKNADLRSIENYRSAREAISRRIGG